jgi:probable phosphoglycerate mutase
MKKTYNHGAPLKLHLIRHGETEWSLSGQHTGTTDIPLTARGEDEARELLTRLRGITFSQILTSPLRRAKRTCELALTDTVPEIELDLAEWDYGDYESQQTEEISKKQPDWSIFRDGGPNGETPAEVSDRADRLIARLRKLEGNIALFTHGHFGRVLAVRWIGLPIAEGEHLQLDTGSLSILGIDAAHADAPVIELWNAVSPEAVKPKINKAIERWENEGGEVSG